MKRTKVIDVLRDTEYGKKVCVKGWVRTHRSSKAVDFIALNDGSTITSVQVVVDPAAIGEEKLKLITTGVKTLRFMVLAVLTIRCRRKDRVLSICASMLICACAQILLVP